MFVVEASLCGEAGHVGHWSWDFGSLCVTLEREPSGSWGWQVDTTGESGALTLVECVEAIERELSTIAESINAARAAQGETR